MLCITDKLNYDGCNDGETLAEMIAREKREDSIEKYIPEFFYMLLTNKAKFAHFVYESNIDSDDLLRALLLNKINHHISAAAANHKFNTELMTATKEFIVRENLA